MKAAGYEIPPYVEALAIGRMQSGPFTKTQLAGFIDRALPNPLEDGSPNRYDVADRAADRLIQRHRRLDDIETYARAVSPVWRWIPFGEPA